MFGKGAMAEQALGQFPPLPLAPSPPAQYPAGRSAVPFLQQARTSAFALSVTRQQVPFLQSARSTPPSSEV